MAHSKIFYLKIMSAQRYLSHTHRHAHTHTHPFLPSFQSVSLTFTNSLTHSLEASTLQTLACTLMSLTLDHNNTWKLFSKYNCVFTLVKTPPLKRGQPKRQKETSFWLTKYKTELKVHASHVSNTLWILFGIWALYICVFRVAWFYCFSMAPVDHGDENEEPSELLKWQQHLLQQILVHKKTLVQVKHHQSGTVASEAVLRPSSIFFFFFLLPYFGHGCALHTSSANTSSSPNLLHR